MLVVETFLMTGPGVFVPLGPGAPRPEDLDALEGAVEVSLNDEELIGTRKWDDVDASWAYIADAMSDFRRTGEGLVNFPDQPVKIRLDRVGREVRATVEGDGTPRSLTLGEPEFVQAVRARGKEFFRTVEGWFPEKKIEVEGR